MSNSKNKPTIIELCQLALEANGYDFYIMNSDFNQLGKKYKFMVVKFNRRTNKKTYVTCLFHVRELANWTYKNGFSQYNPFGINKKYYGFQKSVIDNTVYNGNRLKTLSQLKYIQS